MTQQEFYVEVDKLFREVYQSKVGKLRRKFPNPSDAEDALQCAFERVLTFWYAYDPETGSLETWFNAVLRHCIFKTLSFYRRRGIVFEERHGSSYEDGFDNSCILDEVFEAIEKESPKHRAILLCHYLHGLDTKEIITVVQATKKNVNMVLYRFRKKMKGKYNEQGMV